MDYDLDSLSRAELMKLRSDVDRAIATLSDREKRRAREAAERAVAEFGFTLADVATLPAARGKGRAAKSPARYRNPANPSQTWSGRGRRPEWVNAALAEGKGLNDLAI